MKKRLFVVAVTLSLLLSGMMIAVRGEAVEGKESIEERLEENNEDEEVTEIHDWNDLDEVRDDLDGDYVLENDLDEDTDGYDELVDTEEGWEPIGDDDNGFAGTFDGNDHEISDLYIDRLETDHVGLFGYVDDGGEVRNVGVVDADVSGEDIVGGLAGSNWGGTVENSYATGSVSGGMAVGGLVGGNHEGTVENSYATGSVSGEFMVGGLGGRNWGGTVENSYATGSVSGEFMVGGLVGRNWAGGMVNNSYATGDLSGEEEVGGLVGLSTSTVENSYATGDVNGGDYVGGLVGDNRGTVENSYATGNVSGGMAVGGLVGRNSGTVENSYATGSVSGEFMVGGLVGRNWAGGMVNNSYATGDVSGEEEVGGLVGLSTSTVENSHATGDVSGEEEVGGLVGATDGTVENSYATGSVNGDRYVGGLVGSNWNDGTVENSYATGSVSGDWQVGGLVGRNEWGTVSNSYWNIETSGQDESDGGEGRTTEEMTWEYDEDTYEGWDFEDIWLDGDHELVEDHEGNAGYPALRWQEEVELTISIDGEGTVDVDGEEVKGGWTGIYEGGTDVNLKAIPADGWEFVEWDGTDEEGDSITINMDDDKEITAVFEELDAAYFEVGITSPEDGTEFDEGETVTVDYTVENTGEEEDTQEIVFSVDGDEEDTEELTLKVDDDDTGEFTWEAGEAGDYDLEIASEDTSDMVTVTVEELDPAYFEVQITSPEEGAEFNENDTVTVDYTVENTGEEEGMQDIVFSGDDDEEDTEELTLGAGEKETGEFTWTAGEAGDYDLEIASEDTSDMVTITVEEDVTHHDLTIDIEGQGSTDPEEGTHTYEEGTEVTVTATPDAGWYFEEWTGDYTGTDEEITITMDDDKEITAHFEVIEEYELTVGIEGEGSTDPEEGTHTYEEGESVTVTATPDAGWKFVEWTGDVSSENEEITVTMDRNRSVTAHFEEKVEFYELEVDVEGEGSVKIDGEEVETPYKEEYEEGSEVGLEAVPEDDWKFVEWINGQESQDEEITVVVEEQLELTAVFEELEPAKFDFSEPRVKPEEPEVDKEIKISIDVTNTGELEGQHTVEFYLDGEEIGNDTVTVAAGETETASIYHSVEEAQEYQVEVEGTSTTFTVEEDEETTDVWLIAGLVLAVIALIVIVWMGVREHGLKSDELILRKEEEE